MREDEEKRYTVSIPLREDSHEDDARSISYLEPTSPTLRDAGRKTTHVLWALLSTCRAFTDLSRTLLTNHSDVSLYQECFVDRGPEFGSVYFETLLTRFFITKKERPARQPRMGSVIERLFGTVTTQLLHQLLGNTQATKKPRLLTREVAPKRLAVWILPRFSARLCQYVYEVWETFLRNNDKR